MARKNAKIAILAGNLGFFRDIADDHLFRGDDFELKGVGHVDVGR